MNIQNVRVFNEMQAQRASVELREISPERPWIHLGSAQSADEENRLLSNFKDRIAQFHDKTTLPIMYIFKECTYVNLSMSPIKRQLLILTFSCKKNITKMLKSKYTRFIIVILAYPFFLGTCFLLGIIAGGVAGIALASFARYLQHLVKHSSYLKTLSEVFLCILCVLYLGALECYKRWIPDQGEVFLDLISRAISQVQDKIEGPRNNYVLSYPVNIFLSLEVKPVAPERKQSELLNSSVEGKQVLVDPVTFDEIPDGDLNSPRAVLLTQYAFKVSTLLSMMTGNGNLRDGIKNIMHGGLLAPEEAKNLISHLSAFLCIPDEEDFIKCFEKESLQEREEALKNIVPAVLHKYI